MLATMTWTQWLLAVALIGVCLFLMLVILLQRGRGGGVAGAFGGGGGSGAFGAKTGDVFTWITVVVATIFVGLAVMANYAFDESRIAAVAAPQETATQQIPLQPEAPQQEGTTTKLFPIKLGEDGKAIQIDPGSIQITTSAIPAQGESGAKPTGGESKGAAPVAPPQGEKPAPDTKSPDKPEEDPKTP